MDEINKDYKDNYAVDVLTGVRPTGNLTIANYLGAIKPLTELQAQGLKTVIFVADMHGLTDNEPKIVKCNIKEIIADYLGLGIDPKKIFIYVQSDISTELLELTMLLLRHITVSELLRVPTLKDKLKQNQTPENANTLLAIYPVLMAADILIQRSKFIPVGEDQKSHIEVTKLLARRFNTKYGNTLPIPEMQLIKPLKLLGLKGAGKMSKSDPDNAIFLTDSPEIVAKKIKGAETANPGEMTSILESHFLLARELSVSDEETEKIKQFEIDHLLGKKVMGEFKGFLEMLVVNFLTKFQEKRAEILKQENLIEEIIQQGKNFASKNAKDTLDQIRISLEK